MSVIPDFRIGNVQGSPMPEQWNKYDKTAARKHGKPGRELRPQSVTVDVHAHVGVPEAAKFVEPYLDWATIPLFNFATPSLIIRAAWTAMSSGTV